MYHRDPEALAMAHEVEGRVRPKSLRGCRLPEGFRLVHPLPRQSVVKGQVRWVFMLGYRDFYEVFEYNQEVPDEAQMAWAIDSFRKQLVEAGVIRGALNSRQEAERYFAELEAGLGLRLM